MRYQQKACHGGCGKTRAFENLEPTARWTCPECVEGEEKKTLNRVHDTHGGMARNGVTVFPVLAYAQTTMVNADLPTVVSTPIMINGKVADHVGVTVNGVRMVV